jgi:uncharacterized protein YcfJ
MWNKNIMAVAITAIGFIFSPVLFAYDKHNDESGHYDYARVINVEPVYRLVQVSTPRRECWNEYGAQQRTVYSDSATPTIMGGLIGGIVGSRFGKGKGRDVATVAGVMLGASIANDLRSNRHAGGAYTSSRQVCQDVNDYSEREELDGYQVQYRYRGEVYATHMQHKPGKRIRVHVRVTPVE